MPFILFTKGFMVNTAARFKTKLPAGIQVETRAATAPLVPLGIRFDEEQ
jgi:hypothetical protein